jgi:uroporphyrinogen decarboxylase
MDGYFPLRWPSDPVDETPWERFIVYRDEGRIVTQRSYIDDGQRVWEKSVSVFYRADPPTRRVDPQKIGLPEVPHRFEPVQGVRPVDNSHQGLKRTKTLLGEQGLVGAFITGTNVIKSEADIYRAFDEPEHFERVAVERVAGVERRFADLLAMEEDCRPDFLCVGGSGTLVYQTMQMFRQYAFPAVRRAIELASEHGIPTHVHSCGPEAKLVEIMATETDLTVIDPLEVPPMGDCNLAELKRRFGQKIVLKGNLHTTNVMLRGSVDDVVAASRKAIDDAATGGRFILSTGDQCGRDTPDENLRAMIETARTYGRYRPDGMVVGG